MCKHGNLVAYVLSPFNQSYMRIQRSPFMIANNNIFTHIEIDVSTQARNNSLMLHQPSSSSCELAGNNRDLHQLLILVVDLKPRVMSSIVEIGPHIPYRTHICLLLTSCQITGRHLRSTSWWGTIEIFSHIFESGKPTHCTVSI